MAEKWVGGGLGVGSAGKTNYQRDMILREMRLVLVDIDEIRRRLGPKVCGKNGAEGGHGQVGDKVHRDGANGRGEGVDRREKRRGKIEGREKGGKNTSWGVGQGKRRGWSDETTRNTVGDGRQERMGDKTTRQETDL